MMVKEENSLQEPKKAKIDLDAIIKAARSTYDKKEEGLAKRLATGISLNRPKDDDDFILWTRGEFWHSLTNLKGLPFGKIIEIAGKPDSGKSSLASIFMSCAQEQDVLVLLWDAEQKFGSYRYDKFLKGSSKDLLVVDSNNIIEGAQAVTKLVVAAKDQNPNIKILICWDSIGSSLNSSETSEEEDDFSKQPGLNAKEVGWAIKKFAKLINRYVDRKTGKNTIAVLGINQVYQNLGSVGYTEKGGQQLAYLSSLILQMSRKGDLTRTKDGERYKYGITSRAKVKKNHLFDGQEAVSELEIVVSAEGIQLAKDVKGYKDIQGWDVNNEE